MHFKYYRPQTKFAKVMFSQVSFCCLSNGGLCPGGGLSIQRGGPLSRGISVHGGLCPRGSLSKGGLCPGGLSIQRGGLHPGGLCPGGSLSMGVFVQGGLCPRGVLCPGGLHTGSLCPRGSMSRGSLLGRPPYMVTCLWYASYWNAFLFYVCIFRKNNETSL